ncbi:MAG: HAD family phosphatase [Opitutaceae bacterium]
MESACGVIFDWDGVIVDSSKHHETSWERLARLEGKPLPVDHFLKGFGKKNEWIIPNLLGWTTSPSEIHRLSLRKESLYRECVVESGLEALPGVRVFLDRLREAGVPTCIGSSTHRQNIVTLLGVLGMERVFGGVVCAEDVTEGKPHPEVFLKAAGIIGLPPHRCVVFEDAFAGLEAARAGGMKAIAVATTHPRAALLGRADRVVDRLDAVEVADLVRLVEG